MSTADRARVLALLLGEFRATQSQNTGNTGGGTLHEPKGSPKGGQFTASPSGGGGGYKSILPPDSGYKSGGGGARKPAASAPQAVPQAPATPRTMKSGDSGEDVRYAQYAMNLLGFKVAQDGNYGPDTEAAVKQIQARLGVAKPNGHLSASQLHKLQDAVRLSPCIGAGQRDLEAEAQWEARSPEPEDEDLDEDGMAEAVTDALDEFVARSFFGDWEERAHDVSAELRIPGGVGGGRWTKSPVTAAILKALKEAKGPDSFTLDGKPIDREPLRKAAVARGIKLPRGASRDDIVKALLDDVHGGKSDAPSAPKSPGAQHLSQADRQAVDDLDADKQKLYWQRRGTGLTHDQAIAFLAPPKHPGFVPEAAPSPRADAKAKYAAVAQSRPYASAAAAIAELTAKKQSNSVIAEHVRAIAHPDSPDMAELGPRSGDMVDVYDVKTGKSLRVPRSEAAAGMGRYAKTLGAGTPAAGVAMQKAMELAQGNTADAIAHDLEQVAAAFEAGNPALGKRRMTAALKKQGITQGPGGTVPFDPAAHEHLGAASAEAVREAVVKNRILAEYQKLRAGRPDLEFAGLADLRDATPDVSREEFDKAMQEFAGGQFGPRGTRVIPIANRKALKERDHAAAVDFGGDNPRHAFTAANPQPFPLPGAPAPGTPVAVVRPGMSLHRGEGDHVQLSKAVVMSAPGKAPAKAAKAAPKGATGAPSQSATDAVQSLAAVAKRQGTDAPPRIGDKDAVDAAIAAGGTEIFRGSRDPKVIQALKEGPYDPGRGLYGVGYYFTASQGTAEVYRGADVKFDANYVPASWSGGTPDGLVRGALEPSAKVADYETLLSAQKAQGDTSNVSAYAASKGYDAIRVSNRTDGVHPEGFYPDQYVVLNRKALLVQAEHTKGAAKPLKSAPNPAEILASLPADLTPAQRRARLRSRGVSKEEIDALVPLAPRKRAVKAAARSEDLAAEDLIRSEDDDLDGYDEDYDDEPSPLELAAMAGGSTARARELALLGIETRALGHDVTPGHDELHHYWTVGPGLAKWAESPKPWTTLVAHLTKYVGPEKAKIYASRWFIEVFHFAAGSDLNRVTHGKPPRGHRVGPG